MRSAFRPAILLLVVLLTIAVQLSLWAATDPITPPPSQFGSPIHLDRGSAGLLRCLRQLRTRASMLMINAHPDDEDGGLLAQQTRGLGARAALMSLTRGEGGQNAMSLDLNDALAVLRTQELLAADQYYGVDQFWSSVIDYGFSKTREEAEGQWGHDRVLRDVVRVVRITRPLILTSVFAGAPTDGHGNHQISGQMAQEAFVAAGDPNRFPEQIREGIRPWQPLKMYARVPFFSETKDGIYDYATDTYVPVRFFDYLNKTWIQGKPDTNISVAEGALDEASGYTFLQMGREGLGHQKSQNGGITIPEPSLSANAYHRYASRVRTEQHERSFYDGIDVTLPGIASLAGGDSAVLKTDLQRLDQRLATIMEQYRPSSPNGIAPALADALSLLRSIEESVKNGNLEEGGKQDVLYELRIKEGQLIHALTLATGLSMDAGLASDKQPASGPTPGPSPPAPAFEAVIPTEQFHVQIHLFNGGTSDVSVKDVSLHSTDGKAWSFRQEGKPQSTLKAEGEMRLRSAVKVPDDALLTRPFFTRQDEEQPFYDVQQTPFRNDSVMPYPLVATVQLSYHGQSWTLQQYVQTSHHVEGIGTVTNPLIVAPAISVEITPAAGAVPLSSSAFTFTCTLHSNVKGSAKGNLRLNLPAGWQSAPPTLPFEMKSEGETKTVAFQVQPHDIAQQRYQIKAEAEYDGKTFTEGYRMIGYAGIRSYPYYRPAVYEAVGLQVTTVPHISVAFVPGTGDGVPRALQDLQVPVRIIAASELQSVDLSNYDAVILGVRAYAAQPLLRASNSRLLDYVQKGGTLIVQYNTQNFGTAEAPFPLETGNRTATVADEHAAVQMLQPENPLLNWPNKITNSDFDGWQEERGHGFLKSWDTRYVPLLETHDPGQVPQKSGLLLARVGKGTYVYDALALYRQLAAGVPGSYRILANLVSASKNPNWRQNN